MVTVDDLCWFQLVFSFLWKRLYTGDSCNNVHIYVYIFKHRSCVYTPCSCMCTPQSSLILQFCKLFISLITYLYRFCIINTKSICGYASCWKGCLLFNIDIDICVFAACVSWRLGCQDEWPWGQRSTVLLPNTPWSPAKCGRFCFRVIVFSCYEIC